MDINATLEAIKGLNNLIYLINKRDKTALAELNRIHMLVYGSRVRANCTNCHIKAFHLLTSLTIKDLEDMQNAKFKIKQGVMVEFPARSGQFFTNASGIPNEVASEYLSNYPKSVDKFDVYPGYDTESKELDLSSLQETPVTTEGTKEKPLERNNKQELMDLYFEKTEQLLDFNLTKKEMISELEKLG